MNNIQPEHVGVYHMLIVNSMCKMFNFTLILKYSSDMFYFYKKNVLTVFLQCFLNSVVDKLSHAVDGNRANYFFYLHISFKGKRKFRGVFAAAF